MDQPLPEQGACWKYAAFAGRPVIGIDHQERMVSLQVLTVPMYTIFRISSSFPGDDLGAGEESSLDR